MATKKGTPPASTLPRWHEFVRETCRAQSGPRRQKGILQRKKPVTFIAKTDCQNCDFGGNSLYETVI